MFAGRSKAEMRRMVGMSAYEIERFYASLLSKGSYADKATLLAVHSCSSGDNIAISALSQE